MARAAPARIADSVPDDDILATSNIVPVFPENSQRNLRHTSCRVLVRLVMSIPSERSVRLLVWGEATNQEATPLFQDMLLFQDMPMERGQV